MVNVTDMAAYEEFTRRHLFGGNVRRFETMAVMGRMKFTTAISLADGWLGVDWPPWTAGRLMTEPLVDLRVRGEDGICPHEPVEGPNGVVRYEG